MFGVYGPSGVNNMSGFGGISGVHTVVIKERIVRASVGGRGSGAGNLSPSSVHNVAVRNFIVAYEANYL